MPEEYIIVCSDSMVPITPLRLVPIQRYRHIEQLFIIQTICQTYSDIEYESLCVILARNILNGIKDIKLIDVYLYNRYILVSLQKKII